jgi:hypothetical protein
MGASRCGVPDGAGHRRNPPGRANADADVFDGAAAVLFQVEPALEGVVDRRSADVV